MDRQSRGIWWAAISLVLSSGMSEVVLCQTPSAPTAKVQFASDVIPIHSQADNGFALNHGGIVVGSEEVQLDGMGLQKGTDYSIDYGQGVIYLLTAKRPSGSLSVTYKYDPAYVAAPTTPGFNGFTFNVMPGALSLNLGMGMTERLADGSVLKSNMFGFANNFHPMGSGSALSGSFLVGSQSKVDAFSNLANAGNGAATNAGSAHFIVQDLVSKMLGGNLNLNFQDISKNFGAYSNVQGQTAAQLQQLQKEAGLKREGMAMNGVNIGGLKFSNNFSTITDGAGAIVSRGASVVGKSFHIGWSSQSVGSGFTRFSDLSESNKADLQRSLGLTRSGFVGGLNLKSGTFSLATTNIADGKGGIDQKVVDLNITGLSFEYGNQSIQSDFAGFGNLLDPEKQEFGSVGGFRKDWLKFATELGSAKRTLTFDSTWLGDPNGQFVKTAIGASGPGWTVSNLRQDVDRGFDKFSAINPSDTTADVTAISQMYGLKQVNAGAEAGAFQSGNGLSRDFTSLEINPNPHFSLGVSELRLSGLKDGGVLDKFSMVNGPISIDYKHEVTGINFNELSQTLGFEKQQLGLVQGLNRSDLGLNWNLGKGSTFAFSSLAATASGADAGRRELSLQTPKLQVNWNTRDVASGFTAASQLIDPESGLLASLIGNKESDLRANWAASPDLNFAIAKSDSMAEGTSEGKSLSSYNIGYNKKGLSFGMIGSFQSDSEPTQCLIDDSVQQFFLKKEMGNFSFHVDQTGQTFSGTTQVDSTGQKIPDFLQQTAGVSVKLGPSTSFATEQIKTDFQNGQTETTNTNSITQNISKRAGVTLSDTRMTGQSDSTHRDYGFWYDLGGGLTLRYGYIRQLNDATSSTAGGSDTLNSVVSLGQSPQSAQAAQLGAIQQGNLGSFAVGGGYAVNQWGTDAAGTNTTASMRTQSFSNIRLNTAKPIRLGNLKDIKLNFSLDTAADNYNWIKEDRQFGFTGSIFGSSLGFGYHGQMDPSGNRAADRAFSFTSDPSDKRFISLNLAYKVRTVPSAKATFIRNVEVVVRPSKKLSITNSIQTNPEVPNGGVILGSVTQGSAANSWKLEYKGDANTSYGASWQELVNGANNSVGQTAGLDLTLFGKVSPLKLFYGMESVNGASIAHRLTQRWSVDYVQKVGPRQNFNFFLGDLSYAFSTPTNETAHNWTARVDYQLQF